MLYPIELGVLGGGKKRKPFRHKGLDVSFPSPGSPKCRRPAENLQGLCLRNRRAQPPRRTTRLLPLPSMRQNEGQFRGEPRRLGPTRDDAPKRRSRPPPKESSRQATTTAVNVRILSYNIHKGIGGLDRRYRPERIAETIAHYDPHVVLLQEVDDGVPRSRLHRQVDWLGDRLGYDHRAYQHNVRLRQGHYGNAILSRLPVDEVADIELTVRFKKRRRALVLRTHIEDDHHTRSLVIANVHLGLAGYERLIQIQRLLDHERLAHLRKNTPLVIGGDFNDAGNVLGRRVLIPAGFQEAFGTVRTFPAAYPLRALDRVYFRGELTLQSGFGGHTKLAQAASDHLPVIAEFDVPSATEA